MIETKVLSANWNEGSAFITLTEGNATINLQLTKEKATLHFPTLIASVYREDATLPKSPLAELIKAAKDIAEVALDERGPIFDRWVNRGYQDARQALEKGEELSRPEVKEQYEDGMRRNLRLSSEWPSYLWLTAHEIGWEMAEMGKRWR